MTRSVQVYSGSGILPAALTCTFFVCKVTGLINWPWIWVFSPIWIPLVFVFGVLAIVALVFLFAKLLEFTR